MGGSRIPNDPSDFKKLLSGPRERCATGIDWTSDVRIVAVPRIDMNMEMGDRVPVEFVVHLDGREELCNAFRDEHHVVPEATARGRGQVEWFAEVLLRDDRAALLERGKGLPVDDSDRVELETPGRPVDPLAERDADDLRLSGRQTSHPSQHRGE